jgi:hypothetical protein
VIDYDKVELVTQIDWLRRGLQACAARLATVKAERDAIRKLFDAKEEDWIGERQSLQSLNTQLIKNRNAMQVERDAARGEAQKLRRLLDGYIGLAISVRDKNTPEWMAGFVEDTNRTLEMIGDDDRVLLWDGNIYVKRLTNKGRR